MTSFVINEKQTTMYPNYSTIDVAEQMQICALGFDNNLEDYLTNFLKYDNQTYIHSFDTSFRAYQWLESTLSKGDTEKLPKALLCDFDFLKEENYMFVRNVRTHSSLRVLPIIVIKKTDDELPIEVLRLGIDDCYELPVQWNLLEQRIEFLHRYKPLYLSSMDVEEKIPDFKIPLTKRIFDVIIASIAIVLLAPIWLLIGIAIKLESKGSIIYTSSRVGTGYQVFDFLKFRSMYNDADKRLNEFKHLNQYQEGDEQEKGSPLFVKYNNDPRVTKVGRFIRKTSLDELPQLINVLKGDMSIVGNRPLPLYEAKELTRDAWAQRFLAPAGCTGLWQISKRGKSEMSADERIELDITYAKNYSFWYDFKILLKTLPALIQDENV